MSEGAEYHTIYDKQSTAAETAKEDASFYSLHFFGVLLFRVYFIYPNSRLVCKQAIAIFSQNKYSLKTGS